MRRPICVATGDVHFTPATLELATEVIRQMIGVARGLGVPVVLNGDTLDTKAIIRAECSNRLIELMNSPGSEFIVNVGNHDLINEKSTEHALNFLRPYCTLVDKPQYLPELNAYMIPYRSQDEFIEALLAVPAMAIVFAHQGVQGADLGHYTQDKTSVPQSVLGPYKVILSHYHRRQCVGTGNYLGSPYSQSFGEAVDGEKGFSVVYDDGSLEFISTELRAHRIIEITTDNLTAPPPNRGDLVWVKLSGPRSELEAITKATLASHLGIKDFKLDKICTDAPIVNATTKLTGIDILYKLIESTDETKQQKNRLKALAKDLLNEDNQGRSR